MTTNQQVQQSIEELFRKRVRKDARIHNAYLSVQSEKLGIDLNIAAGSTGDVPAHPNQRFYIASISKLFASVLFGKLVESGLLTFDDPISAYIEPDLLEGLHVYKDVDYTAEIQIKHLLNNTSGLHDIMEDKPKQGKSLIDLMFDETSRTWTPRTVIEWAKQHLTCHFPPGQGFHYSDTGYHLLGLIVERVTAKPYHEALRHYIFEPCGMIHSSFANYSEPMEPSEHPMARLYGRGVDFTEYRSLTLMFAGGGIISTTADLHKFMRALVRHEIIQAETIEAMKQWEKFFLGIDYGYGLMNIKTVPIFMPQRYNAWGNAGSTGTFMFYHPATDSYLVGALNHLRYSRQGLMLMLKTIDKLVKCR
jgi:D-alanyl-D-alanine carboxypeptidase